MAVRENTRSFPLISRSDKGTVSTLGRYFRTRSKERKTESVFVMTREQTARRSEIHREQVALADAIISRPCDWGTCGDSKPNSWTKWISSFRRGAPLPRSVTGATPRAWASSRPASATDEAGQEGDVWMIGNGEPIAEVVPERDAELGVGVHQA